MPALSLLPSGLSSCLIPWRNNVKIALFIPEGVTQLVLTPETEHEKAVLNLLREHRGNVQWFSGEFYACQGGWWRQDPYRGEKDLILRLDAKQPEVIASLSSDPQQGGKA